MCRKKKKTVDGGGFFRSPKGVKIPVGRKKHPLSAALLLNAPKRGRFFVGPWELLTNPKSSGGPEPKSGEGFFFPAHPLESAHSTITLSKIPGLEKQKILTHHTKFRIHLAQYNKGHALAVKYSQC